MTTPSGNPAARSTKDGFSLGFGDYLRFSKLLLERCGLYFPETRRSELEYRLRMAFAASTCADLDEFYTLLQDSKAGSVEMDVLVNAITISETHFFRDTAQFNALLTQVLPKLIERKRSSRALRIWSAGCSSGEEPYSIAMLLREILPDVDNWSITILGTDINTASLDRARQAIYGSWAFREERANLMRNKYFRQNGNRYELLPEVRNMVVFNKLNLIESVYPSYDTNTMSMDLILCRNVTIYFSEAVTRWVVDRFYDALIDGGWLVVGHSEPSIDIYRRFRVRNFPDTVLYQRMPETGILRWPLAMTMQSPPVYIPPPPALQAAPLPTPATPQLKADTVPIIPVAQPEAKENIPEQARDLLEFGHSEDALKLLLKLVKDRPRDASVCVLLGQAYANLAMWQDAEFWCVRAIEVDKLTLDAYYTLSLIFQHNGKLDKAIEAMKKVVYIDRNYVLGHYGLANLYRDSGLMPQAQKSLDNALRLLVNQPPDAVVLGSRGVTAGRLLEAVTRQQQAWSLV